MGVVNRHHGFDVLEIHNLGNFDGNSSKVLATTLLHPVP